ncbi:hypothetical protein [Rhodopila globiformis]|uniref:hypothetical protein n=1 Tax=Rhodopila globiformis TaxID=1071 RepID=UPI001304EC8B|nr:hypothetical protein [Rhodopila globiformis]
MHDDRIQYVDGSSMIVASWQPVSIDSASPYLKAIALVVLLLATWAGLCAI